MSVALVVLFCRILVVNAGDNPVHITLLPDTSFLIQGKHLFGEVGDTVKVFPEASLSLSAPSAWDIAISSESGDIEITCVSDSGPYPGAVSVVTASGDLTVTNPFPSSFTFTSMSGDLLLTGLAKAGDWDGSEYNLQTASGRIDMETAIQGPVWVNTLTGMISMSLDPLPQRASYDIRTGTGSVKMVIPDTTLRDNFVLQRGDFSATARRIGMVEPQPQGWLWRWGSAWSPTVMLDYNRACATQLGLGLNLSLGDRGAHTGGFGVSYAFGPRTAFWFMAVKPRFVSNPDCYIDARLFDSVSTYDTWGMGRVENAFGAFLFKEDARDYFRLRGASVALEIRPSQRLSAGVRYDAGKVSSLERTTNFSLLGPDTFRLNPAVNDGALQTLTFFSEYINPGVRVRIEYISSLPDSFDLNQLKASVRLAREGWSYFLATRFCFGYSFAGEDFSAEVPRNPFAFGLGGIGTVPAYPYKEQIGSRAILWNIEYQMKLRNTGPLKRIIAFADAGEAWNGAPSLDDAMLDLGVGFSVIGISLRVAQDVLDIDQSPHFFLRVEQGF